MTHRTHTYRGWTIQRGSYHGTTDDRADRWYITPPGGNPLDKRGPGAASTLREARERIDEEIARDEAGPCPWCNSAAHYGDCYDPEAPEESPCDCGVSRPDRATGPGGAHAADCASRGMTGGAS